MKINYANNTIEMTKAEAKEAGKYNSDKYLELKEIRADFPNFRIVTKSAPKKKDTYKGLDYDYIEKYLDKYTEKDDERRAEFDRLRGYENGKKKEMVETATYGEVKAWFLNNFSEIENFNKETNELREKIRKETAKRKVA